MIDWLIKEALLNIRSEMVLIKSLSSRVTAGAWCLFPLMTRVPYALGPLQHQSHVDSTVSDQRPQPRSSARTHNDVNYGAHQPQALSCASDKPVFGSPSALVRYAFWLAENEEKSIYALSLSHTLSCRFITFQIKLSFPTTASLFLSWKSAGSVRASSMHPYSMHFIASWFNYPCIDLAQQIHVSF